MISGLIGGFGTVILVQQYGIAPLSRALTLQGLIGGLASGIVIPSAVFALVVFIHNRRLARALGTGNVPPPGPSLQLILMVVTAAVVLAPLVSSPGAAADVSGPCGGTINGVDLATVRPTKADAFEFGEGDTISGSFFVNDSIIGGRVQLVLIGRRITVVDEPPDPANPGDPGDATFSVPFEDISWIGTGLIEVRASADLLGGGTCEIGFMVNIAGNPLDTVAGKAGAAAAAAGAAGLAFSGLGAAMEGARTLGDLKRGLADYYAFKAAPGTPPSSGGLGSAAARSAAGGPSPVPKGLPPPQGGTATVADSLGAQAGQGPSPGVDTVTVSPGDNLWDISEAQLQNRLGRPPTNSEVADYWRRVIDANQGHLQSGDPNLIYPGETIRLPDLPGTTPSPGGAVSGATASAPPPPGMPPPSGPASSPGLPPPSTPTTTSGGLGDIGGGLDTGSAGGATGGTGLPGAAKPAAPGGSDLGDWWRDGPRTGGEGGGVGSGAAPPTSPPTPMPDTGFGPPTTPPTPTPDTGFGPPTTPPTTTPDTGFGPGTPSGPGTPPGPGTPSTPGAPSGPGTGPTPGTPTGPGTPPSPGTGSTVPPKGGLGSAAPADGGLAPTGGAPAPATGVPVDGGLSGAQIAGASMALGVAAALVPARYLLLSKFGGSTGGPPDPRLVSYVEEFVADLPLDESTRAEVLAAGPAETADARLTELAGDLENDFLAPDSPGGTPAWPPRVAATAGWLQAAQTNGVDRGFTSTVLATAPYIGDLAEGRGRDLDRLEERAVWPWTRQ